MTQSLSSDDIGKQDVAVLSRRSVLTGMGCAGVLAVAGSALLAPSPAEALVNAPVMEPQVAAANAAQVRVAERVAPEENLADVEAPEGLEVTARRRRRYWHGRRRYWRGRRWRRGWRRRYRRVVCRRRWYRGRLVRACRRVW